VKRYLICLVFAAVWYLGVGELTWRLLWSE
jgi:hypothetical protein